MAKRILAECTGIATANGYPPDPAVLKQTTSYCTDPKSTLTSSMYRDMIKGAAVEVDHILGDLLDRAGDLATPLVSAAYVQLKVYEAGRNSQPSA